MGIGLLNRVPYNPWLSRFEQDSHAAVAELLGGSADVGTLEGAEPSVLLIEWLKLLNDDQGFRTNLDEALADWIESAWGEPHLESAGKHVGLTISAWLTVTRVIQQSGLLAAAALTLREQLLADEEFLNSLRIGTAQDPLATAYSAVARYQEDDSLVPVWLRLASLEGQPWERGAVGVLALLSMPLVNKNRLPTVALRGLRILGSALYERAQFGVLDEGRAKSELGRVAGLCLLRFPAQAHKAEWQAWWREEFEDSTPFPQSWLPKVVVPGRPASKGVRRDPPLQAWVGSVEAIKLRLLEKDVVALDDADRLIDEQVRYARISGDADPLAKTTSNLASSTPPDFVERALEWLNIGRRWESTDPYLWTVRTNILAKAERIDEALDSAVESARRFPDNFVTLHELGESLRLCGRLEEMEAVQRELLLQYPNRVEALYSLGLTLLTKGQHKDAEDLFRRALEIDKQDKPTLKSLRLLQKFKKEGQSISQRTPPSAKSSSDSIHYATDLWLMRRFAEWRGLNAGSEDFIEARTRAVYLLSKLDDNSDLMTLTAKIGVKLGWLSQEDIDDARRLIQLGRDRFPRAHILEYYEQRLALIDGSQRDPLNLANLDPMLKPVALRMQADDPRASDRERDTANEKLKRWAERTQDVSKDDPHQIRLLGWYLRSVVSDNSRYRRESLEEDYVEALTLARRG